MSMTDAERLSFIQALAENYNTTYEQNLSKLGISDVDNPDTINIYPKDFESKEKITEIIDEYNNELEDGEDGAVLFEDVGDDLFGSYYYDENGNHVHIYLFESMMWDNANSCWKYIPKSLEPNLRLEIEYKQKEQEQPKRKFLSRFRKKRNNNEN